MMVKRLCVMALMVLVSTVVVVAEDAAAVAEWREGTVSQETLDSWLRFHRRELAETDLLAEVETLLLMQTLAAAAEARGAAEDPALRLSLVDTEQQELGRALRIHVAEKVVVSDERIAEQIRAQPELRQRPRRIRLFNIYQPWPEEETARQAMREDMTRILAELRAGADFGEVARAESASQSRFRDGLIGLVTKEELRSDIAVPAFELAEGELSEVIETDDGLTILRCDRIHPAVDRSPAEVREMVVKHLQRQAEREAWKRFSNELLTQGKLEIDHAALGKDENGPVARFAGGVLSVSDVERIFSLRPTRQRAREVDETLLRLVIESWVTQVMGAKHARELGLDKRSDITERLAWHRVRLLAGHELTRRVNEVFEPLESAEIRAHYDANRASFRAPPEYDLAMITMTMPEEKKREVYRRGQEVEKLLATGALDFATAARRYSDDESAAEGGALGWLARPRLASLGPRPMQVIDTLSPGEISPLVQWQSVLYVFELRGLRPARLLSFDEAAPQAEKQLGNERLAALQARVEAELVSSLEIRLVP